jgi:hypothetical protein
VRRITPPIAPHPTTRISRRWPLHLDLETLVGSCFEQRLDVSDGSRVKEATHIGTHQCAGDPLQMRRLRKLLERLSDPALARPGALSPGPCCPVPFPAGTIAEAVDSENLTARLSTLPSFRCFSQVSSRRRLA